MVQTKWYRTSVRDLIANTLVVSLVASVAACGGGGVTPSSSGGGGAGVTASPYTLFASNYITTSTSQLGGALGLRSIQGGWVYGGTSANFAINWSTLYVGGVGDPGTQAALNYGGFYNQQAAATATPTSADYQYVSILAPNSGTFDISTAATLLIQMGNTDTLAVHNAHANVFTVHLANATSNCFYDQTLAQLGAGSLSPLGVRSYAIPISSFTSCSSGSLADLQASGIDSVAVNIEGRANTTMVNGENNTIAVGSIGFTSTVSSTDLTASAL
jgi:hypothetical protein